ncbi:Uncharacterized protein C22G7.07c [Golovinomyces cichoracearum]|uniref:Uncharacterized protein C22G7.07c n=1 Tax=Golovinomyces cichoracearum TaxID=62708 RepID=A0A420J7P2_9PEZI|nr:Uncharacterized protein C22G7.07c [Golovinomyces cichoracearum]
MESHILYQNSSHTSFIIDIPRSIEEAQGFDTSTQLRLISIQPPNLPFVTPEPQSAKALSKLRDATLKDILLQKYLELALAELRIIIDGGEWCLKRITEEQLERVVETPLSKKRHQSFQETISDITLPDFSKNSDLMFSISDMSQINKSKYFIFQNDKANLSFFYFRCRKFYIPPHSTTLLGSINDTRGIFTAENLAAPQFNVIVMDPPWPNRSAKRKGEYRTGSKIEEIKSLLLSLPIHSQLADNGIIAIWITNKPNFHSLALKILEEWSVRVIEEWIWLKIATNGEPIFPLTSLWRKPYEVLLVARKSVATSLNAENKDIKRRVLVGVTDRHSRKPNLKGLLEKTFNFKPGDYQGLEVFARNSTSGWWSWGDEALIFQEEHCWTKFC